MGHPAPLPLFQAGASDIGRNFAAGIADGTFAACPDKATAIELRADLRRRAEAQGRPADAVRVMPGLSLFLAASEAEARELYHETHAGTSRAQKLAKLTAMIGLDLSDWEGSRRITAADLPPLAQGVRSRTHAELLHRKIARSEPTLDALLEAPEVLGSAHWQVIGTPGQAIDAIRDWADAGALDGFILFPGGSVPCLDLALATIPSTLAEDGGSARAMRAVTSPHTSASQSGNSKRRRSRCASDEVELCKSIALLDETVLGRTPRSAHRADFGAAGRHFCRSGSRGLSQRCTR